MFDQEMNDEGIETHNKLRQLHNAPSLTFDEELAISAQSHADAIAEQDDVQQSAGDSYGENLAASTSSDITAATLSWYSEIKDYVFGQEEQALDKIGHFSQCVWKGSTLAGFGRTQSESGTWYIVGQYKPPGNLFGNFVENIDAPSGDYFQEPLLRQMRPQVTEFMGEVDVNPPPEDFIQKIETPEDMEDDKSSRSHSRTPIADDLNTAQQPTENTEGSRESSSEQTPVDSVSTSKSSEKNVNWKTSILSTRLSQDFMNQFNFSDTGMNKVQTIFNASVDKNTSEDDLEKMLQSCGQDLTKTEIKKFKRCVESLSEEDSLAFLEIAMTHFKTAKTQKEELRMAFKTFDRNGDGTIDKDELKHALMNMGNNLQEHEVDAMFEMADKNEDGKLDYEEFVELTTVNGI